MPFSRCQRVGAPECGASGNQSFCHACVAKSWSICGLNELLKCKGNLTVGRASDHLAAGTCALSLRATARPRLLCTRSTSPTFNCRSRFIDEVIDHEDD